MCRTARCRHCAHLYHNQPRAWAQANHPPLSSHIAAVPQSVATFTIPRVQHPPHGSVAVSHSNQSVVQHSPAQHADQQCLHSTPKRPSSAQIVQVCKCTRHVQLSAGPTDECLVTAFQAIFPSAAFVQAGLRVMHPSNAHLECGNSLTSHQQNVQETQHRCCMGPRATAAGTAQPSTRPANKMGPTGLPADNQFIRVSGRTLAQPALNLTGCAPPCIKHTRTSPLESNKKGMFNIT
jgi:hypothetical protein